MFKYLKNKFTDINHGKKLCSFKHTLLVISAETLLQYCHTDFFCFATDGYLIKALAQRVVVSPCIEGTKVNTYQLFESAGTVNRMFCTK